MTRGKCNSSVHSRRATNGTSAETSGEMPAEDEMDEGVATSPVPSTIANDSIDSGNEDDDIDDKEDDIDDIAPSGYAARKKAEVGRH